MKTTSTLIVAACILVIPARACADHYNTPSICMASRASILTGTYEYKTSYNFLHDPLGRQATLLSYSLPRQAKAPFTYSPAKGIGPEAGVMRRDPSDIIRVKDLYYVWYSKGAGRSGYDATIWYATSKNGRDWTEKGEALKRGAKKAWDEQSVFTPNILVAEGKYWLFYTGVPKPFIGSGKNPTKTAIGIAVADSPDGPWVRLETNPILIPSDDATAFDSLRVDDACLIFWNGRYWLYYKGRRQNGSPAQTKMGVAIATKPGGPYVKHKRNPLVNGGHEVVVWPYGKGLVSMVNIGPKGIAKTLQYSPDGLTFSKWQNLKSVPFAAGMYRPEAFTDNGRGKMPEWGVHIGKRKRFLPFIERFDCHWPAENSIPLPGADAKRNQTTIPGTADGDRASLVRAKRIMRKIDKDGNGTFEKTENAAAWKRYRKLDANRDQVITIDELRKERIPYLETGGKRKLNIVYKKTSSGNLLMDLYYPTANSNKKDSLCPVIVYTHGGGWAAGSKQGVARGLFKVVFEKWLNHGFAVASVNYRLCRPNKSVTIRDCVTDAKDAVRYLAKNSGTLKLDRTRFFTMGDSAGGQMAQMLLLSSPESFPGDKKLAGVSYKMVAGVSWYGPCDFEKTDLFNHDGRKDFRDRFGPRILGANSNPEDKLARYREISPINYLRNDSPPLLMIQGDKDTTIPVKHAHDMKQRAKAVKAPVEIMIIKNAGHNWRKVGAEIDPSREAIVERTVKFFVDHCKSDSKSK